MNHWQPLLSSVPQFLRQDEERPCHLARRRGGPPPAFGFAEGGTDSTPNLTATPVGEPPGPRVRVVRTLPLAERRRKLHSGTMRS